MRGCSFSHLSNRDLLEDFAKRVACDRTGTAELIACMSEIDSRKLYVPAGYPSMFAWCVEKWRMSEDMAYKRIRAARTGRRHRAIFEMVADGRLHLAAVVMLAPHLTRSNADELLAAAAHQTKTSLERMLATRFPQPDMPTRLVPRPITAAARVMSLNESPLRHDEAPVTRDTQLAPGPVGRQAQETVDVAARPPLELPAPPVRIAPLSPQRFGLQVTIPESTHDKRMRVRALLAHQIPPGDLAQVLDRALDALLAQLERRKYAATDHPRPRAHRASANPRYIPRHVKRAVWARDGGQCTFVSDSGHRCSAREMLEFDHIDPVARDGSATIDNVRLRCRAHNQYEAECAFGAGFMSMKRVAAQRAASLHASAMQEGAAQIQEIP